jgi:hypothetical protein
VEKDWRGFWREGDGSGYAIKTLTIKASDCHDTSMNPQKRLATLAALKETKKGQTLEFGDWKIYRFDKLNWAIKHKSKIRGYYGSISQALGALPPKMLDETTFKSLSDIQRNMRAIKDLIQESLKPV